MTTVQSAAQAVVPPGRLGHPEYDLRSDPRSDPRMVATLARYGLDALTAPAPVSPDDPLSARLEFMAEAERNFEALFADLDAALPAVEGVERTTETIRGVDGNDITLYIHRPEGPATASLPGVLHLHGGGMTMLSASGPGYGRIRDELAAAGTVVVGVEFRNAAGVHGDHPFPAGLDDCTTALEWTHTNRERLGISALVVSGESGGGNLTLATTLRAKQNGQLSMIDGVYAMVPFISGAYGWPDERKAAELPSLLENDGYFIDCALCSIIRSLYDPAGEHDDDPLCWPLRAFEEDLTGLPPHVITVCELDPLRDEGLAYYLRLARAGVAVSCRMVAGVCHAGDLLFPGAMPDLYLSALADISAFADRSRPRTG